MIRKRWHVNHKRVERIWRQEGLKVPKKQPKRARLSPVIIFLFPLLCDVLKIFQFIFGDTG